MSGIVGGYSVNNWLAASAAGYPFASTSSLTDISSKNASQQTTEPNTQQPRDPFANSTNRIDFTRKAKAATNAVGQAQLGRINARHDDDRSSAQNISAQAQTLAAIQPPQIQFSSADFARLMEERDILQEKSTKHSSSFAQQQPQEHASESEHDGDSDDAQPAMTLNQAQSGSTNANDALAKLHALFRTANDAYTVASHPPLPAAISLVS